MKRPGISRGKGFKPRTSRLRATGALVRNAEKTRQAAEKAKPRKPLVSRPKPVTPEEKRARRLVRVRSNGVCEGCDRARAAHWAHRVAEGQGGPWCPSNGLHLCAKCHTGWAHLNPTAAEAIGWIVPSTVDPKTIPVVLAHGRVVYLRADGSVTATERSAA